MDSVFFFNDTATTEIYTLSLHDALPIWRALNRRACGRATTCLPLATRCADRKSTRLTPVTWPYLVCRLLLEKKNHERTGVRGRPCAAREEASCSRLRARLCRGCC